MNYNLSDTQKTERLMNSVMDTYTYFLKVYVQVCIHIYIYSEFIMFVWIHSDSLFRWIFQSHC